MRLVTRKVKLFTEHDRRSDLVFLTIHEPSPSLLLARKSSFSLGADVWVEPPVNEIIKRESQGEQARVEQRDQRLSMKLSDQERSIKKR
jgi:hypothetical protein